ncbi:cell division protein FtsX [Jannaschia sp. Os4]|uniref:cell division protein FtsX n=1 Tax=Jannaschia sp. Os4 TaxID=2807617 RepID=UPI00193986F1|nr:cell division protein FtsX [Jannaschia sp. Os4]MBM2577439.1 cell division protein FtsX [Jannaschia sp. Os4]
MLRAAADLAIGDAQGDRVVPPTGFTVWLTVATAAAMTFLAVFALALTLATGRLADRWADSLAQASTIRLSAPPEQMAAQVQAVTTILAGTPGVADTRVIDESEQARLLEPWLGPDLPLDALPLPGLIEVVDDGDLDLEGLRARLRAEVPGAVLDDHTRWREPLVAAAARLRLIGWTALLLILGTTAAMVTLGARAALAANSEVIRVLRLIGARDAYVARAFTRRFTLRAAAGALVGAVLGIAAIVFLPDADDAGGFLTGLSFGGASWILPLLLVPLVGGVAFAATRAATLRALSRFE